MQKITNEQYEEAYNNQMYQKYMSKIAQSYSNLDRDEVESAKNYVLWQAMIHFNPLKGVKFTTFLCSCFKRELYKIYQRKSKNLSIMGLDSSYRVSTLIPDILMSLSGIEKDLIEMKFVKNMTFNQISEVVGFKKHKIAKKIKKITNRFK